jgi:hypothetical protein
MKDALECISPGLVEKGFKKCGISNSFDGLEGDFIRYSNDDKDDKSNG